MLYGADGPHHGVELQILMHLCLLSHAGSVHEHELMSELIV